MKDKKLTTYQMAVTAVMAAVLCVLGPLTVPIGAVPISLANFVICLTAWLLGPKFGTLSVVIYLVLGAIGIPVFSGYGAGLAKLAGPTGGYLVGYLLLASKTRLPTVFGAAGLVLELILCGSQTGGAWARLAPALRAADLWLFWGAALVLVRLAGRQQSKMPYIAAVPLAVYTVTHFIPSLTSVAAVSFVVFSVVMLWFAAIMIRAYNDARIKK